MILPSCTGPCVERVRQIDWSDHPVGSAEHWPSELKWVLASMLRTAAPKLLLWGRELTTFYNDAFSHILCDLGAEGIGAPFSNVYPEAWPFIRDEVEAVWRGCERRKTNLRIPGSDGDCYYDVYFATIYDSGHAPAGVLIDVHDTTPSKRVSEVLRLENRDLQQLFTQAPVLMAYGVGPELRLQFVNDKFRELMGGRPLEGLPAAEAIPEIAEQGFDILLDEVLRTGKPWIGQDVRIFLRDPEGGPPKIRYLDFVYQPVKDDRGEVTGILCTGTDVTDNLLAQEASERAKHQILHATRVNAMGTMAITLAHELNQPLAAASNYLAASRTFLLREGADDAGPALESLQWAQNQILRAGEVIRRIRSVLRGGEANRKPVSLEEALDRVIALLEAGDGLDVTLTRNIAPDVTHVMADEIQLEQVIINLVRNAAEASRCSERKEVVVSTERAGQHTARVSLRDFGRGLVSEQLEDLFGGPRSSESQGLGVGLSLSRTLVESNGGALRAANAPDGGAIFTFDLQLAEQDGIIDPEPCS